MKLLILVDNSVKRHSLYAEHGFAVLINNEILFDAGQSSIIINNAKNLNVNFDNMKKIIISHGHYDHTGGIKSLRKYVRGSEVFLHPEVFVKRYHKNRYIGVSFSKKFLEKNFRVIYLKEPLKLSQNIIISGEIKRNIKVSTEIKDFIKIENNILKKDYVNDDMFLILKGNTGFYLLCGCCHSGILNSLYYAKEILKRKITGIIGGIHLFSASDKKVKNTLKILKKENIKNIFVSHCSGDKVIYYGKKIGLNIKRTYVGDVISI